MLVAFENRIGNTPLRLLRPGFRHCYLFARTQRHWQVIDPLCSLSREIQLPNLPETRLMAGLAAMGVSSLKLPECHNIENVGNISSPTCVENVKCVVGIKRFWTLTPYHLFTYLLRK